MTRRALAMLSKDIQRAGRLIKAAAKLGAILAVVCHFLPPHYRLPCETVARVCSTMTP